MMATNKNSGVYLLKVGDACYVGSTKNIKKRIGEHKRLLRLGAHQNRLLQEAYDKYQEVLEEVLKYEDPDTAKLLEEEQRYYDIMRKTSNLVNRGKYACSVNKGMVVPQERRDRISKTLTGKLVGENNPFYCKTHTPEMSEKLRKMRKSSIMAEGTKGKLRSRHLGRKVSSETIEKRQLSRTSGGKPYCTRGDFVALDENGIERERFSSIKEFLAAGYCRGPLYKNMREKTPYRCLYWHKEV